ncbi:MAG: phosphatase PAP2 family protein [Alphaproteobacteria bacterium]|nr:phosphatase PAP2 family protein [Alphaproteobacteria bacterium]
MRYGLLVCAALALGSGGAQAGLLAPGDFAAGRYLPPPPDAATTNREMDELHAIAARSTADDRAVAKRDAENETPTIFNDAAGFDLAASPETFKLLTLVGDEEEDDTKDAKAFFHRDRPYAAEPAIKACTPVKPGKAANSYPSGHATRAFSMGVVLADLVPARSQEIMARASQYAERRLVCGVHYRSDIVAGQQFGTVLALKLMQNPAFQAQMAKALAEIRAAHP